MLNEEYGMGLRLRIVGDGTYRGRLERYLHRLGVNHEVTGFLPYEEYVTEVLSRALFLANLSSREAFGLTVNEANAVGVPVVVVEPWGLNFSGRSRTLVTRLDRSDREIAREIAALLEEAGRQPRPEVPSWSAVVDTYVKALYSQ